MAPLNASANGFRMVLVAVLLARFTWSLINPAEPDDSAVLPIVTVDSTATGSMNLETLTTLNLFGAAERGTVLKAFKMRRKHH